MKKTNEKESNQPTISQNCMFSNWCWETICWELSLQDACRSLCSSAPFTPHNHPVKRLPSLHFWDCQEILEAQFTLLHDQFSKQGCCDANVAKHRKKLEAKQNYQKGVIQQSLMKTQPYLMLQPSLLFPAAPSPAPPYPPFPALLFPVFIALTTFLTY